MSIKDYPQGGAVDKAGDVYLAYGNRVHRLPPDAAGPGEGITVDGDQRFLGGLAVDGGGGIYGADTDHNRVLKLAAGETDPTELPFTGLDHPTGVAIAADGRVYVVDAHRVVALVPE